MANTENSKKHQDEESVEETVQNQTAESKTEKQSKKTEKKKGESGGSHAELAAAQQKAQAAEEKVEELKNSLLRTAAEYDNYRKRTQKEQESSFQNGVAHAAEALLPILDTLDAAAQAPTTDEEYKKGVMLTLAKSQEVFEKLGIHEIEAMGQPFDPNLHNAVMQQPAEGAESGIITLVMQKGYTLNERVIRHSMVAVAP